ncbi:HBR177Wp [Eremothecium sinecaudum]|uniref:HBR177Wp n=1 Tax=Eremothecium sinecaudum TaxID=45286 RepID=A0A109UWZ1_9SACH|nr:HBR177Wp [Eremothecium sinecaudum]AMD19078.1 HBR177Wp [Eremothecium sinecaudum]
MSAELPLGLAQFPITKTCMITCVGVTLLASLFQTKYWFLLQYDPFISEYRQYWRYLTFQLGALNESDVALYMLIWYQFRQLERLFGSKKYVNLILLCWIYNTITLTVLNIALNMVPLVHWNRFSSGALPILLSLFHFYKEYTPTVYEFEVLLAQPFKPSKEVKWTLSDQFLINSLVFLSMLNQGWAGFGIGFSGWICGIFLDKGLLPGKDTVALPIWRDSWNRSASTVSSSLRATTTSTEDTNGNVDLDEQPDEPARPLAVQLLDTFRR